MLAYFLKREQPYLHSAPLYPCHKIKPVEAVLKGSIMWYVGPNQMQKNLTIAVPYVLGNGRVLRSLASLL